MAKEKNKSKKSSHELPPMFGSPCIELSSNREAVVEGCAGVLEYSQECIKLNTAPMMITFRGRGLDLRCISPSALIIGGCITGVEFTV